VHYLLHRRRLDAELAEELAAHRAMAEAAGGPPLGNALRWREESREAWGFMWLDHLAQDLRYAGRAMRGSPGFTAAAVLVLAIGIGATVAAFGAFNMVALRPLPIREPQSILRFQRQSPEHAASELPYPAVAFYREHTRTLSAVLAMTSMRLVLDDVEPAPTVGFVTANFFEELGARPAHGRLFGAGDAQSDAAPVVVLGHGFWASHFGSDPAVVGRSVRLSGQPVTIIGVADREFPGMGSTPPEFWAVLEHHGYFVPGSRMLTDFSGQFHSGVAMWGRLAAGSSAPAADDEMAALALELRRQRPADVWEGERLVSSPGGYGQPMGGTAAVALVGVLVLLILVVACGNLGGLLLARGASRQREMALRVAIGAGTARLVRQLFTESLALALLGCLGGLVVGSFVLKGILTWTEAPPWFDATLDARVVAFALAISCLAAVLFGLAPALHVARPRPRKTLSRSLLIGVQVASSCILLIVAGLLTRAFDRATSTDPGFEVERVLVVDPALLEHGYTAAQAGGYLGELGRRLQGIAGVEAVAFTATPPLGDRKNTAALRHDGRTFEVFLHVVDAPYLTTMKIPLLRGRDLAAADELGVVVSESLARRLWPDRDPLGESFQVGGEMLTVAGIAASARSLAIRDPEATEFYRLAREADLTSLAVVVRTAGPTDGLAPAVSLAANGIDRTIRPQVHRLEDQFRRSVGDIERGALAVGLLGVIALAVACLGVVGLVGYSVAQRTREIGIRMALGAGPRQILGNLSRQFRATILGGLVLGILGAAGLSQLLRRELYGLSTLDPMAYLGAVALFLVAVALAALWPARRALRVDPLVALRSD